MTYDYSVSHEGDGTWNVWALKPYTGDKADVLSNHQTRIQALAAVDRYRQADMRRLEAAHKRT